MAKKTEEIKVEENVAKEEKNVKEKPELIVFPGDASSPIYEVVSEKFDMPIRVCGKLIWLKKGEKKLLSKSCLVTLSKYLNDGVKITPKYNK